MKKKFCDLPIGTKFVFDFDLLNKCDYAYEKISKDECICIRSPHGSVVGEKYLLNDSLVEYVTEL